MEEEKKRKIKTSRRNFIKTLIGISGTGLLGSFLATFKSVFPVISKERRGEDSPVFTYVEDTLDFENNLIGKKGEVVKADHFKDYGQYAKVFFKRDPVLLMKLEPQRMKVEKGVEQGFVAYSAICTHLSCVTFYRKDLDQIYCPCHDGKFDPYDGAKVIAGPPPRPLPQYPVKILEDGTIIGSEPIGEVEF